MAVYIDELRPVGSVRSGCFGNRVRYACHLMADTDAELERVRKEIGLRRGWLHGDHYDLPASKRAVAIRQGAVEVPSSELVKLRQRKREAAEAKGGG